MSKSSLHILQWDCRINRRYDPFYFLGSNDRYDPQPSPPVTVQLSADFDSDESALAFERAVRELLEKS